MADQPGDGEEEVEGAGEGPDRWRTPEVEALVEELEALVERVDELSLSILREAVEAGATSRPEAERRLTRVRNALVRAVGILR